MRELPTTSPESLPETPSVGAVTKVERRRVYLAVWLTAWLFALLVQVPGMGTVDSLRRLQVTRSWGTDEPAVRVSDRADFGMPGREGVWQAWYGPGQSWLMWPADLIARSAERFVPNSALKFKFSSALVATLTFPPLVATTVLLVFVWLGQLGFLPLQRLAGAFSLLLASSHLYYTQVHMENSLQVFLLVLDAVCLGRWMVTGQKKWLVVSAGTAAWALNIRVPALADHGGLWLAALAVLYFRRPRPDEGGAVGWQALRWAQLVGVAVPILLVGLLLDRWYQWHRFGTWAGTYITEFARHQRTKNLTLSPAFPFDGDFWEGLLGPLISPTRGIVFSDPLMLVLVVLLLTRWRRLGRPVQALLLGLGLGFASLVFFYARVSFWNGSTTWGNRYTLTPIHGLTALVLPLWLRHVLPGRWWTRHLLPTVLLAAMAVQVSSILLPSSVEDQLPAASVGPLIPLARVANALGMVMGEAAPPPVNPEDWRLNLFPGTLGMVVPRLKWALWAVWWMGLGLAGWMLGRSYRLASRWDGTIEVYEDDRRADWWPDLALDREADPGE